MCGIVGVYSDERKCWRNPVASAVQALWHRGPDAQAIWSSSCGQVIFGHTRLKILDLSESAAQPMISHETGCVLTYNGEIYNFNELRKRLNDYGIVLRSNGDTEVLLRWLERYGPDGIKDLQGMFAFAFWDPRIRRLLLARDPLGIKPLYFSRLDRGMVFASEVRAILAGGFVPADISQVGVIEYLTFGSAQGPRTLIEAIDEFPAGHSLDMVEGKAEGWSQYWKPCFPIVGRAVRPVEEDELRGLLDCAVFSHSVSDVPLGAFLSGGLDSSAITALLALRGGREVHTLSVSFPEVDVLNESAMARKIANFCHTIHHEIAITEREALAMVEAALDVQDQPSIDGVNTFLVARAARQAGLTVALSGLGGDEIFGGYTSFIRIPRMAQVLKYTGRPGRGILAAWADLQLKCNPDHIKGHKLLGMSMAASSIAELYAVLRGLFSSAQIARLYKMCVMEIETIQRGIITSQIDAAAISDQISWLETSLYMRNMLLRDTDCMSMANSLEVRVPFLHLPLVEAVQAAGSQMRRSKPRPKQALIETMRNLLPREAWDRPKQGFELPFQQWLAGPLRAKAESVLLDVHSSLQMFFDRTAVSELWFQFQRHPKEVGWSRIWALVSFAAWLNKINASG